MLHQINVKEEIIEALILHQPVIKKHIEQFNERKDYLIGMNNPAFKQDIEEQCNERIRQWIAFYLVDVLPSIPIESIIIQLEKIDIEEYLSV